MWIVRALWLDFNLAKSSKGCMQHSASLVVEEVHQSFTESRNTKMYRISIKSESPAFEIN